MMDCLITPDTDKNKFLDERRNKKSKTDGHVKTVAQEMSGGVNTSLFDASFCNGDVKCTVLADKGADVCIMSPTVYHDHKKQELDLCEDVLPKTQFYTTADSEAPPLSCSRKIVATVKLQIRHVSTMMLRGISRLVSDRSVNDVIIGRNVLRLLGLDNHSLMAAAADRLNGESDVGENADNARHGEIRSLLTKRGDGKTFHSCGEQDDEGTESLSTWILVKMNLTRWKNILRKELRKEEKLDFLQTKNGNFENYSRNIELFSESD